MKEIDRLTLLSAGILAGYLAKGADDAFSDNAEVAVLDRSKADSGLVRKDLVEKLLADEGWKATYGEIAQKYLGKTLAPKPADGCPADDADRDGVADALDKCPSEREDNLLPDPNDGCPAPDPDKDSIRGALDAAGVKNRKQARSRYGAKREK